MGPVMPVLGSEVWGCKQIAAAERRSTRADRPVSACPVVVLEQTAEALSALDIADAREIDGLDHLVLDPLVVSFAMVVRRVLADRPLRCRSPKRIKRPRHSDLIESTKRSAWALQFGAW